MRVMAGYKTCMYGIFFFHTRWKALSLAMSSYCKSHQYHSFVITRSTIGSASVSREQFVLLLSILINPYRHASNDNTTTKSRIRQSADVDACLTIEAGCNQALLHQKKIIHQNQQTRNQKRRRCCLLDLLAYFCCFVVFTHQIPSNYSPPPLY